MDQRYEYCSSRRHDEQAQRRPSPGEVCHPSLSMATQNQSMGNSYVEIPGNFSGVVQDGQMVGSDNFSWNFSGSADLGSQGFRDDATNSTTSSWLLVQRQHHSRTYSNESSEGGMSEAPCISEPKLQLSHSGEFLVDTAAVFLPDPVGHHQLFQPNLSTLGLWFPSDLYNVLTAADSGTSYNTRNSTLNSVDSVVNQGATESFNYHDSESLSSYIIFNEAEDSWNHLIHRVPTYPRGFPAFGPVSPSPSFIEASSIEDSRAHSLEGNILSSGIRKDTSEKRTAILKWDHTVVRDGGPHRVPASIQVEPSPKTFGCRRGKLPPETKEKAKKVRQIGACWPCWLLKVPVSFCKICYTHLASITLQNEDYRWWGSLTTLTGNN